MGLDMYLYMKNKNEERGEMHEIMHWRKANQIRNWFLHNLDNFDYDDDCGYYEVTKEQLIALKEDCLTVLNDHSAVDIMPTLDGFFFGSTEYDEWYFSQLKYTVERIEEILELLDFNEFDVYYSEWY